ncbi:DUF736 domain-containing protein [Aminobacter sp. SS-2016]|uniref:DUF736 domain-containing protein n=1 Tax=Aminobacter sp. Y103A TaxID=1870862 RepID=UPI00257239E5|nr:DUF736 domain-containing protein [Aminobacter sp. SS-2016]
MPTMRRSEELRATERKGIPPNTGIGQRLPAKSPVSIRVRITAGNGVEVGAGWKAVSNDGEEYISVKLDDPSFNAPITAALWPSEKEGEYSLIWNRPKREA